MIASLYNVQALLICIFLFLITPSCTSLSFKRTRFDQNDTAITYLGGAFVTPNGTIEFNSVKYICQVGQVLYRDKVPLWDPDTKALSDFTTKFSFSIQMQDPDYAAGFAFFLAPVGFHMPLNSAGGFLGLFNITNSDSPLNQIVHVEFDTFSNPEWDPHVQHVGINNNSVHSAEYTEWNASLHDSDTADVSIRYNSSTLTLSASWKFRNTSSSKERSALSYVIDLRYALPPFVSVGFTAATSYLLERHILKSWEFSSSLEIDQGSKDHATAIKLGVGLGVPGLVLIGAVGVVLLVWRNKRRIRERALVTSIYADLEKGAGPRRFSYRDLVSATNNFSAERKMGEGGFGAVYRGYLPDLNLAVAVKKISRGSKQGKKEYITEVKIISQLRHRNLVQLIGWCHDHNNFLLVYEFMPNGSLDSHLFGNKSPLIWPIRYRIALGLASALLYLHEEWEQCVVHRDLKSSNIMLDSSFNVKLGDFGLARLMDHELGPKTTGLAGTLGYLAPEYISTGRPSKESDVYSFGVVTLEIATGRKAIDSIENKPELSLVEWVWDLYGTGELTFAVDERLGLVFDEKQLECLMIVGLWCAHPDRNLRPSIRQAIHVLNFEAPLPNLPAKMPVPMYHVPASSECSGSGGPIILEPDSSNKKSL